MAQKPADHFAINHRPQTNGQSVLILTTDDTQDLEFFYPYYRFTEAGFRIDVVTPTGGAFKGKQGMGLQETKAIKEVDPMQYQLLYIPGGKAPAALKKNPEALELVKRFAKSGHPIAAICHGPQLLAAADLIKGRTIAAWPEVEKEITAAGATYADQPTVVDGPFVTARWPGDLPSHLFRTLQLLQGEQPQSYSGSAPRTAAGR